MSFSFTFDHSNASLLINSFMKQNPTDPKLYILKCSLISLLCILGLS